jgi:hypothetical protein
VTEAWYDSERAARALAIIVEQLLVCQRDLPLLNHSIEICRPGKGCMRLSA